MNIYEDIMEDNSEISPKSSDSFSIYKTENELYLDKIKLQNEFYNVYVNNEIYYQNHFFLLQRQLQTSVDVIQTLTNHIKCLEDYIKTNVKPDIRK